MHPAHSEKEECDGLDCESLSDEASRVSSMANNALIWEGNCEMRTTTETGMQIMSQRPAKICGPHDACEAGCNAIQMAGITQIRPWLMQAKQSVSSDQAVDLAHGVMAVFVAKDSVLGTASARE